MRLKNKFLADERGVEPTALKIMAGIVMLAIGLSIGVAIYTRMGKTMPSFSVSVSPSSATAHPGDNENAQVTVSVLLSSGAQVTLAASFDTARVDSVDLSPNSGTVPFTSSMTIHVKSTAPTGKTTITITGTGADGTTNSGSFELTVA